MLAAFVPQKDVANMVGPDLDAALAERRQELVRFIEGMWDKYRVTLANLLTARRLAEEQTEQFMATLGYQ